MDCPMEYKVDDVKPVLHLDELTDSKDDNVKNSSKVPFMDSYSDVVKPVLQQDEASIEKVTCSGPFMASYILNGGGQIPSLAPTGYEKLELCRVLGKGRGLFVKTSFQAGDVVFTDIAIGGVHHPSDQKYFSDVMTSCTSDPHDNAMMRLLLGNELGFPTSFLLEELSEAEVWQLMHTRTTWGVSFQVQDGKRKKFCGVWPVLALLNHSCHCNVVYRLIGETMVIMATRQIEKGEELVMSYVDQCMVMEDRHAELRFTCDCKYCELERTSPDMRKFKKGFLKLQKEKLLGASKADKAMRKLMQATEKLSIPNKQWLRIIFWEDYIATIESNMIDQALETHLEHTPGNLQALKVLFKTFETEKSLLGKFAACCKLAYPGLDSESAIALLKML